MPLLHCALLLIVCQVIVVMVLAGVVFAYRRYQNKQVAFTDMDSTSVNNTQTSHSMPMSSFVSSGPVLPSGWTQHSDTQVCHVHGA